MLYDLFIDVGNTHTVFGLFPVNKQVINKDNIDESLSSLKELRFSTNNIDTSDDIFSKINIFLEMNKIEFKSGKYIFNSCVLSSVVPQVNYSIESFINKYLLLLDDYYVLEAKDYLGIDWQTDDYKQMGADRVADILGAIFLFNDNFIILDFGTAITIDIIYNKKYLGGAILPGFILNIKSLFINTAKLPMVEIKPTNKLYDNTTVGQIQLGTIDIPCYGINYILQNIKEKYPVLKVIITGGFSNLIKNIVNHNYVIPKLQFLGMKYYISIEKELSQNKSKSKN